MRPFPLLLATSLLAAVPLSSAPARAGESFDNCTGTISSLPAVIATQGTWCVKENLTTSITSGVAITINANNVTLDCNDFKIGGLQAGLSTNALGIAAANRMNTTIRNCGLRGFMTAIRIAGDTSFGALIEDNRLDNNTVMALEISGGGHVVRRNRVVDTGGRPAGSQTDGIRLFADQSTVTDNLVSGVTVTAVGGDVVGINTIGDANEVGGNYVTGLVPEATGTAVGILSGASSASSYHDNRVLNPIDVTGNGILSSASSICSGNHVAGYANGIIGCVDGGDNVFN